MPKVFIGVGHGGSDPGAVSNNTKEKDLNLSIALACRDVLERHGVSVKMSRTKDEDDSLSEEIRECNAYSPDLAVDIHNNAGGGDGAETFYHYGGGVSKTLAENILAEIVKIGQNSRGAKIRKNSNGKDYYGFIRNTICPAVIVECAFVDNSTDLEILATEGKRQKMGEVIAKGILKTLGIEFQAETGTIYRVQVGAYKVRDNAEAMLKKIKAAGFDAFITT
ncbi:MAG: N-acetylmuramoyl-L-alanine amidase [Clostridia bacterium]|nr:N-acetylmuramoyl-L-alanine amidase [Clostridia bacterium]